MDLTSENVAKIFFHCLFKEEEDKSNYVIGQAVKLKVGFHPERLKESEPEITTLLSQLPDEFKKTSGGGWSFLNACTTITGDQWTGDHSSVDQLVALGNAVKKVDFLMPRESWDMFPGGMPYLVVSI